MENEPITDFWPGAKGRTQVLGLILLDRLPCVVGKIETSIIISQIMPVFMEGGREKPKCKNRRWHIMPQPQGNVQ